MSGRRKLDETQETTCAICGKTRRAGGCISSVVREPRVVTALKRAGIHLVAPWSPDLHWRCGSRLRARLAVIREQLRYLNGMEVAP